MEAKLRKSLIPVLVALMLMMLCCERLPRAQQTLAEDILLGQRDGYALYALADAPQGEERFFDSDTLYQGELLYVSPGHPLDSQRTRQQARNVRHDQTHKANKSRHGGRNGNAVGGDHLCPVRAGGG